MSEKINVQCYKCKTVYEIGSEMCGQVVECAVCFAVFAIPELQHKVEMITTHPYVEDDETASNNDEVNLETSTNLNPKSPSTKTTRLPTETVKINITSQGKGMIPKVDDKFGVDQGHNPLRHDNREDALKDFEKTQKEKSKWWHFGKEKK